MLGRYRKIYARLWRHPGFVSLSDGEKIVALYVLTGPQSNRLGLINLSVSTAAEDLGNDPRTFTKRLERVCETFHWCFDCGARVLYIPSWFRWNPPENINVMKGNLKDLNEIHHSALVEAFARNLDAVPETLRQTFVEGLRERYPQRSLTQYQETVSVTESEAVTGAKRERVGNTIRAEDAASVGCPNPPEGASRAAQEVAEENAADAKAERRAQDMAALHGIVIEILDLGVLVPQMPDAVSELCARRQIPYTSRRVRDMIATVQSERRKEA